MKYRLSFLSLLLCYGLILATAFLYYPKWKDANVHATISWDVSGYYLYLPAAVIYKDLKELKFFPGIVEKYNPGPGMGQAYQHPSGHYVMKYSMGQALQMLPWFMMAHWLAEPLGYPADGFSLPYQAAMSWSSLLIALLGLWFLRRILLRYFQDGIVAASLLALVWGTNYLEYTAITGAMTHNWLFTVYALLIWSSIRFYERGAWGAAITIGILVGWATLTRPTEIITLFIPLGWGLGSWQALRERWRFWQTHWAKVLAAVLLAGAWMMLQAFYWHYVTGHWIVYSYQDQSFDWLTPHYRDVLISAKAGWLSYSPIMILAIAGFIPFWCQHRRLFPLIFGLCMLALYLTAAWHIWWYGGSLGQRNMVQAYPLWAFPLAAMMHWLSGNVWRRVFLSLFGALCIYLNLWWTHQAHKGGLFISEQMNTPYFMKVVGRFKVDKDEALKLLDNRESFSGARRDVRTLFSENFENGGEGVTAERPIAGTRSFLINGTLHFTPEYSIDIPEPYRDGHSWLRASLVFRCGLKEWDDGKQAVFMVRYQLPDQSYKTNQIKLHRLAEADGVQKNVFFDSKIPKSCTRALVRCYNGSGDKEIWLDDLMIEAFQ